MKLEDLKKIKEQLEIQKAQNNKKIELYDERAKMARVNSFENKVITTLGFSVIGYLPIIILSSLLVKNMGFVPFTNFISFLSYSAITASSSFGFGVLVNSLFNKKYKTKERYKAFSNAKTKAEKIEEEVHYQIELEKVNNRNKVIDETIKLLETNQDMINTIAKQYDLYDKTLLQTKEEVESKINKSSDIIKKQYEKLDILTTQNVLHNYFWNFRSKIENGLEIIIISMMVGIITMGILTVFPFFLTGSLFPFPSISMFTNFAIVFGPLITGTLGTSMYLLKKNKIYNKVFNILNLKLGENALEENLEVDSKEQEKIKSLIENQIKNLSLAAVQLYKNKRYLESNFDEESNKKESLEQSIQVKTSTPSNPNTNFEIGESTQNEGGPKLIKKLKL